ncbi:MAG: ATP-binding protein [Spirochaetes bacterium]|nr:ATP-binding protein [Spirochaetota bacterium]
MQKDPSHQSLSRFFLQVVVGVYLIVGVATFFVFYSALRSLSRDLGTEYAKQLLLKEKADISHVLDREITLARKLADSPLLQAWTENEDSPTLKREALAELESYKKFFTDRVYFFVVHRSGHYYFNDGKDTYRGKELQYTLDPKSAEDSWYFSTVEKVREYSLNVNYDKAIKDTKVWINVVMRKGNTVLGMAGTGLSFGSFMERFIRGKQRGVLPVLMDQEGVIQAHPDQRLVELSSISKEGQEKSTVFRLFPKEKDRILLQDAMKSLLQDPPGSARLLSLQDQEGLKICALAFIPEIQWYTLILFNDREVIGYTRFLPLVLVSGISLMLLGMLILLTLRKVVLEPLGVLTRFTKDYQQGKIGTLPTISRQDEIGILAETLKRMMETIREYTTHLEDKVKERTEALRDLFDHMEEGILSFGSDLKVAPDYSRECERLFGKKIEGQSVLDLIDPEGKDRAALFRRALTAAFRTRDPYQQEVYLSLLPSEVSLKGRILQVKIRVLNPERMMMILKDITYNRKLEEQLTQEQQILKFVVNALGNRTYFLDTIETFEGFLRERPILPIQELYRYLHTYKGVLSQLDLVYVPRALHQAEEHLSSYLKSQKESVQIPSDGLDWEALHTSLEQDKEILKQYLGQRFFERKQIYVLEPEDLLELERLALKIRSAPKMVEELKIEEELSVIPKLRTVRIFDLFSIYPSQVMELAKLRGKVVAPLQIKGDNVRVRQDKYESLVLRFVHLLRNAIIHGIEDSEERVFKGKPAEGRIELTIRRIPEGIEFKVQDDGKGIDWAEVRRKAIEKGLLSPERAATFGERELQDLMVRDGVSTRKEADLFSGRGIGLSAVQEEVARLGGKMEVHTEKDRGTEITITIPDSEVYI